jgi:hypothetical protein
MPYGFNELIEGTLRCDYNIEEIMMTPFPQPRSQQPQENKNLRKKINMKQLGSEFFHRASREKPSLADILILAL